MTSKHADENPDEQASDKKSDDCGTDDRVSFERSGKVAVSQSPKGKGVTGFMDSGRRRTVQLPSGIGSGASTEQASSGPESEGRYGYGYGYAKSPMGPNLPAALSKPPDLKSLLAALRRRWVLALVLGIICAGVTAALTTNRSSTKYQAVAWIRIAAKAPHIVFETRDVNDNFETYKQSQVKMITSTLVLKKAVLEHPKIEFFEEQSDPVSWLKENLVVDGAGREEMVSVSLFRDSDSQSGPSSNDQLVELVNAVVDAYMDHAVILDLAAKHKQLEKLDQTYRKWDSDVTTFREKIEELAQLQGVGSAEEADFKKQMAWDRYRDDQRELQRVQSELTKAQKKRLDVQGELDSLKNQDTWFVPQAVIDARIGQDPEVGEFKARVDQLAIEIVQYEAVVLDKKRIDKKRSELRAVEQRLRTRLEELNELALVNLKVSTRRRLEEDLDRIEEEVGHLETEKMGRSQQMEDRSDLAKMMGKSSFQLEQWREDLAGKKASLRQIGRERFPLQVELDSSPRIELKDRADVARPLPIVSGIGSNSVILTLLVLGVVVLGVSLLEFQFRRIDSAHDVSQLGIPVIGGLPIVPNALREGKTPSAKSIGKSNASTRFMESMDEIRTILLRDAHLRDTRVVMITSADAMEGKTTLSMYLSISLAYAGRKVLLIDGDLRRPSLHRRFGMPRVPGLGDALRAHEELDQTIRPSEVERLWVMPAGRVDREVFRALAQDQLGNVLPNLSSDYDFIIIDTPPTLPVADALQIGQHVDTTLLTALRNVTQTPKLYSAIEKLGAVDIAVLGAIVQGISRLDYYRYERQYRLSPSPHSVANQSQESQPESVTSA